MEILVGEALPSIAIGLVQASLIFAVSLWWFRIPFNGSVLLLYAGLLTFATACVGIGLSVSALSLNMQQAMVYMISQANLELFEFAESAEGVLEQLGQEGPASQEGPVNFRGPAMRWRHSGHQDALEGTR